MPSFYNFTVRVDRSERTVGTVGAFEWSRYDPCACCFRWTDGCGDVGRRGLCRGAEPAGCGSGVRRAERRVSRGQAEDQEGVDERQHGRCDRDDFGRRDRATEADTDAFQNFEPAAGCAFGAGTRNKPRLRRAATTAVDPKMLAQAEAAVAEATDEHRSTGSSRSMS